MTYRPPIDEMRFVMRQVAEFDEAARSGALGDLDPDLVDAVLEEAGRFAAQQIAPLNRLGDTQRAVLDNGTVRLPEEWARIYHAWVEAGWGALAGPDSHGGQGLPHIVAVAVQEMWNSACLAFALNPILTQGAVEALSSHGSEALKDRYLPRLVSGAWTGTMNLTEPQAGSDLNFLRTRAEPAGDGTYRLFGTKIYITYGEHELTENILHFVLARLPDAPPGSRGISLFLVPKVLVNEDGTLGARNDVRCAGIEHKLGIHASPTCTMVYGDEGGAVGYLVGEENRGLACMFTMMNSARLLVGVQGVAIAERAYQQALAYAQERRQGWEPGYPKGEMVPIIAHPDIRRSLLTMKALTAAARTICYQNALALDRARHGAGPARERAQMRANLLTPISKAFSTDIGVEVASMGVQVHGGMGYVEETGAAQHLRDARILPIYEGTNGIQAIDLVMRKIGQAEGAVMRELIQEFRDVARAVREANAPAWGQTHARLDEAVAVLEEATGFMLDAVHARPAEALAGASPYLRLFGLAAGGAWLAKGGVSAARGGDGAVHVATARFFAENLLPQAQGLSRSVREGAEIVLDADAALGLER